MLTRSESPRLEPAFPAHLPDIPCLMHVVVCLLIVALVALRQAPWFWEDRTLVFGFLPVGLLYHMGISLAAAGIWLLAVRSAWPATLDDAASEGPAGDGPGTGDSPEGGAAP